MRHFKMQGWYVTLTDSSGKLETIYADGKTRRTAIKKAFEIGGEKVLGWAVKSIEAE